MTGRDLVTVALKLLGAVAPGESLEASEATDGLATLNRMIDSWSTEELLIYAKVREEFPLTAGKQTYTMGVGGDFNTARPMAIETALIKDTAVNPALELPITIYTKEQWARILLKQSTSTFPLYLYAEGTYPNETINLYPVPTQTNSLVLYSHKPLSQIATLDTVLSFPPGYEEALIFNLAIRLAPEYGKQTPNEVVMTATESKASIKRMNQKPRYLRVDDALIGRSGVFNWLTGEPL